MKRLSWKYVAGLIDGEGCFSFDKHHTSDPRYAHKLYLRPRVRMCLAANAKSVIDSFHANFGGHISYRKLSDSNPNWQDAYEWSLAGYEAACPFVRNIVNHLIIKKEQARLVLWMETHLKGKRSDQRVHDIVREESAAMKRDPHRLSEEAQRRIWDAIVGTPETGVNGDLVGRNLRRAQAQRSPCGPGPQDERQRQERRHD